MAARERTWQIRYERFLGEVDDDWLASFLLTPSDGQSQEVNVRLTYELQINMASQWNIDVSDPDFIMLRLGTKAIFAQLEERGEVDDSILLSSSDYPGYPDRPELDKNCRHLKTPPGKMLCGISSTRDKWLGMTNVKTCEQCEYPFLVEECQHLVNAETIGVAPNVRRVSNAGCALGQPEFVLRTCRTRECFVPLAIPFGRPEERRRLGFLGGS
jgi:hypothetical protein